MEKYLEMIQKAKNKTELKEISYMATKDQNIKSKQWDIIAACCVWKEWQITTPPATLGDCAKQLKIQKYIKYIK